MRLGVRFIVVLLHVLSVVEARVYCQDSHASPWLPFGYSCPVMCQNIVNAIERLKIMDFENLIYQKPHEIPIVTLKTRVPNYKKKHESINEIDTAQNAIDDKIFRAGKLKKNPEYDFKKRIYKEHNMFDTEVFIHRKSNVHNTNHSIDNSFYKDVIKLTQLAAKTFKGRCVNLKDVGMIAMLKCARKSNIDGSFLTIMTNLLNKYANSVYKFTEEMTEVLLKKILGENTDLRNNIFDVNKLLGHLRQALHRHKEHERRDIIALSPSQCLTISLPGCFCKAGFVESSGQCVKPADCVVEPLYEEYLARVVVT